MVDNKIIQEYIEQLSNINYYIIEHKLFVRSSEYSLFGNKINITDFGSNYLVIDVNDIRLDCCVDLIKKLYHILYDIMQRTNTRIHLLDLNITYLCNIELNRSELISRIEEFEVFKNGDMDYISLDSLYDFYKSK